MTPRLLTLAVMLCTLALALAPIALAGGNHGT
jgi:hypothetical protein